jgi:hypothetical protein
MLRDIMADQRPDGGIAHVSPDRFRNHFVVPPKLAVGASTGHPRLD